MMTEREFEALAAAYGGALDRWPAARRAEAARLLATSTAARRKLDDAAALDTALEQALPAPALRAELTARILADAAECAAPRATPARAARQSWMARFVWRAAAWAPAPTCLAAALLGVWLGYAGPDGIAVAAEVALSDEYSSAFGGDVAAILDEDDAEFPL